MGFRIIKRMCNDVCVYWRPTTTRETSGLFGFQKPIQIKCRWEDEVVLSTDMDGNDFRSLAQVNTLVDVEPEGVLWHGKLTDLADLESTNPFTNKRAWVIRRFDKLPTLKKAGRKYLRTAFLGKR